MGELDLHSEIVPDSSEKDIEVCPECGGMLELYVDEERVGRDVILSVDEVGNPEIVEYNEDPYFSDVFDQDSPWQVVCSNCQEEICPH